MNLADYLSELLGQYEEVSVPGLGYFIRERVNGYYNDKEARFYPPYHKVKFVDQEKDDDTFVQYVADKKNISLASSKYFVEKFISKLKEQAVTDKYLFADLGQFYTDNNQLVFKPNDRITDDPAFYGYPTIDFQKKEQPPLEQEISKPVFTDSVFSLPVTVAPPVEAVEDEYYFDEEVETKNRASIWLIILLVVAIIALSGFGLYTFSPETFNKITKTFNRLTGKADTGIPFYKSAIKTDTNTTDTGKKAITGKDSAVKSNIPAAPPVAKTADTIKTSRWEIIVNSFRHLGWANNEVKHLKTMGINAKIVTDAPGPLLKVSAGTFNTQKEAETAMLNLIKAGKIGKKSQALQINE